MTRIAIQRELVFQTWGGRRKGAGRKRHTNELPHAARPELRPTHPQHVTLKIRRGLISLRKSISFAAIKQVFRVCRDRLGIRLCHFAVLGDHIHFIVEAEDRTALGRAIQALNVRLAAALNRLMKRKGRVIADRYHVRALKTPTEVLRALNYLKGNAQKHGFTKSPLPDPFSSWTNLDVIAEPHSWLLRRGFQRAGPSLAP